MTMTTKNMMLLLFSWIVPAAYAYSAVVMDQHRRQLQRRQMHPAAPFPSSATGEDEYQNRWAGKRQTRGSGLSMAFDYGDAPSDYDSGDLSGKKTVEVDTKEEDALIRDQLKRELLLLSSITDRGEYATTEEQNILIDLVAQLEALNPTANPAENCYGDWDLALSSTQFFRSSPFFQSIRIALGDSNKAVTDNAFDLHDRATTASRVGRVRQSLSEDGTFRSEVDLEVGMMPGFPLRVKGTVVTTASFDVVSESKTELRVEKTQVRGSNVPFLNQILDDPKIELPVNTFYNTVTGSVPVIPTKTYYVDEGMRITRDIDDNFFVFTRA